MKAHLWHAGQRLLDPSAAYQAAVQQQAPRMLPFNPGQIFQPLPGLPFPAQQAPMAAGALSALLLRTPPTSPTKENAPFLPLH